MIIQFLSFFDTCDVIGADKMTYDQIIGELTSNYNIDCSNLHFFFEGNYISGTATPSDFNATDDDELICFVDHENKSDFIPSYCIPSKRDYMPFTQIRNAIISNAEQNNSASVNPNIKVLVDSPEDYARNMINSGKYVVAMNEVRSNPILKTLFLDKLRGYDARLYNVLRTNTELFEQFIDSSVNQSSRCEQAFSILSDQNREDILRICEMMSWDYSDAVASYLQNGMNMDTWVQNNFN